MRLPGGVLPKAIRVVPQKIAGLEKPPFSVAVAQIVEKVNDTTRQVKIVRMELDWYLKMYFNKSYVMNALDERNATIKGDIVLIKQLDKPVNQTTQYNIEQVIYKLNDIVDPITGKSRHHDSDILAKFLEELGNKTMNNK